MATIDDRPMSGRLPPQAPSSRPPSHSRHRSNSADRSLRGDDNNTHNNGSSSKSSRRSKGSHRKSRGRASSDGVRIMNERYQQQQQQQQHQYYYGGYQQQNNINSGSGYPMQYSNQPPQGYVGSPQHYGPPPGYHGGGPPPPPRGIMHSKSERVRGSSFDASNGMPYGMDPNNQGGGYGSIQPPPRPRTGSKEFNAMNELSSVIGRNNNNGGGTTSSMRGIRNPTGGGGGRPSNHRRTMSDSMVVPRQQPVNLPPLPEGLYNNHHHHHHHQHHQQQQQQQVVMPNPNHPMNNSTNRMRADSYGSQGSFHSGGPPGMSEMDAILARHNAAAANHNNNNLGGGNKGSRSRSHMRQNSVNLYMKSFKGEVQPKGQFKDVLFGILFILQLVLMCIVGLKFGPDALVPTSEDLGPEEGLGDDDTELDNIIGGFDGDVENEDDTKIVLAYQNIVKMAYTCGAFAIIVSALALAFMMAMSRRLVYVALVLSIGVSFAWGTIGIGISPKSFVPITGIIALMLTVGYMFVVWDRIPFASANLTTALTGVRDNLGLVGVAFLFQFLALVCSIYYTFTFVGLHDAMHAGALKGISDNAMIVLDALLLVSYYWTYQVLRHIVMVTVAGTIGSWWFRKPSTLYDTFITAMFYNFGSICYGSLFVGFVQFLRQITEGLRPNREDSSLMCLYQCSLYFQERIVSCVDTLADSFTPWAFTYVGMYHYGLKEAGHKANELFHNRGWSRIVTDDLISSVLAMVSLVIGGLTGSFAVILQALDGHGLTSFGHPVLVSFTIGFMVGVVLSIVLFSIIDSSVCAVIVCFAGSPVEFHRNHQELSHEMRHAWREVWPGSLDIDSSGMGMASPMI